MSTTKVVGTVLVIALGLAWRSSAAVRGEAEGTRDHVLYTWEGGNGPDLEANIRRAEYIVVGKIEWVKRANGPKSDPFFEMAPATFDVQEVLWQDPEFGKKPIVAHNVDFRQEGILFFKENSNIGSPTLMIHHARSKEDYAKVRDMIARIKNPHHLVDLGIAWQDDATSIMTSIRPSTVAAESGFKAGQRVVRVGETPIKTAREFFGAIQSYQEGSFAKVTVEDSAGKRPISKTAWIRRPIGNLVEGGSPGAISPDDYGGQGVALDDYLKARTMIDKHSQTLRIEVPDIHRLWVGRGLHGAIIMVGVSRGSRFVKDPEYIRVMNSVQKIPRELDGVPTSIAFSGPE